MLVIEWLNEKLAGITPEDLQKFMPKEEVDPTKERVVGEVPENLRPLYVLAMYHRLREQELRARIMATMLVTGSPDEELVSKAANEDMQADGFLRLFWVILRDTMNLWKVECIGVRKGWKVVMVERR